MSAGTSGGFARLYVSQTPGVTGDYCTCPLPARRVLETTISFLADTKDDASPARRPDSVRHSRIGSGRATRHVYIHDKRRRTNLNACKRLTPAAVLRSLLHS